MRPHLAERTSLERASSRRATRTRSNFGEELIGSLFDPLAVETTQLLLELHACDPKA